MSRYCTSCGKEIPEGMSFCVSCGAPAAAPWEPEPQEKPVQTSYYAPPLPMLNKSEKVVGMGAFFGLMLLFSVPVIGFIACIVFAFAPENKNMKNFARGYLLYSVLMTVLSIILGVAFYASAAAILEEITGSMGSIY